MWTAAHDERTASRTKTQQRRVPDILTGRLRDSRSSGGRAPSPDVGHPLREYGRPESAICGKRGWCVDCAGRRQRSRDENCFQKLFYAILIFRSVLFRHGRENGAKTFECKYYIMRFINEWKHSVHVHVSTGVVHARGLEVRKKRQYTNL